MAAAAIVIWRQTAIHPDYEVGSDGRVRSIAREQIVPSRWGGPMRRRLRGRELRTWRSNSGYLTVALGADRAQRAYVHRLVAEAFLEPDDTRPVINHRNGDKTDNSASNLERVTASENMQHASHVLGWLGGQFGVGRVRHGKGARRCA